MATRRTVTLREYLQQQPFVLVSPPPPSNMKNTRSDFYSWKNVNNLGSWKEFDLGMIREKYKDLLTSATLLEDPFPAAGQGSLQNSILVDLDRTVISEAWLQNHFFEVLRPRLRAALRRGFEWLGSRRMSRRGLTWVECGDASEACPIAHQLSPDVVFYDALQDPDERIGRLPGDFKLWNKWRRAYQGKTGSVEVEFRQVLSQLKRYMKEYNARYGFVLTEHELVAAKRRESDGELDLSETIEWRSASTDPSQTQLTLLMALWYLGMLAAEDKTWKLVKAWK